MNACNFQNQDEYDDRAALTIKRREKEYIYFFNSIMHDLKNGIFYIILRRRKTARRSRAVFRSTDIGNLI